MDQQEWEQLLTLREALKVRETVPRVRETALYG